VPKRVHAEGTIGPATKGPGRNLRSYSSKIIDEDVNEAYAALQWLAYSERPLYLDELAEAIVVQPNKYSLRVEIDYSILTKFCTYVQASWS
jgi:hypothetical protein